MSMAKPCVTGVLTMSNLHSDIALRFLCCELKARGLRWSWERCGTQCFH
jgi:hypothetical protein